MNNLMMPQQQPMPPEGMAPQGMAPQGMPQGAPQPQFSPEQIADARNHMKVMGAGLMELAQRPMGSLSKRDVYNAIGEMIAQGAFSTPQAKQQLVAQLAEMPDDEKAIRQMIGSHLLQLGNFADHFDQNHPEVAPDA